MATAHQHHRSGQMASYSDDDGTQPEAVAQALATYRKSPREALLPLVLALQESRLLLAMVPRDTAPDTGRGTESCGAEGPKGSEMAAVSVTGRDGRKALVGFTSVGALQRWNPEARPLPVSLAQAADAAASESNEAVLVDLGTEHLVVIEGSTFEHLALGHRLARTSPAQAETTWGWVVNDGA